MLDVEDLLFKKKKNGKRIPLKKKKTQTTTKNSKYFPHSPWKKKKKIKILNYNNIWFP